MNALFVDIANLYYCVGKRFQNRKLDYAKIRDKVGELGQLYRAFAYGVQMGEEANPFINCLKKLGYDTKYKRSRMSEDNVKQVIRKADWDIGLTLDVVRVLDRVDTVVLGSADADLIDLVRFIRDKGVRCIIFACGIPQELREAADFYIEIEDSLLEVKEKPCTPAA
jgi:uncharacterized LabA/DUF88 family protein